MNKLHRLLCRQLRRQFGDQESIPDTLQPFIEAVDSAYHEFDNDRAMVERSLEMSSNELMLANTNMRAIFQALPDLFFLIDADNKVIDFKAGESSFLDLAPKDVLNQVIKNISVLDDCNTLSAAINTIRKTNERVATEYEIKISNKRFYIEASLFPVARNRIAVLIRDMTARKIAELNLQASDQRLRKQNKLLVDIASNKSLTEGLIEDAFEEIISVTADGLNVERTSIWFFDDSGAQLVCAKLFEKGPDNFSNGNVLNARDYPDYFKALKDKRTIVADNTHTNECTRGFSETYLGPLGINSMLDSSINVGGRIAGVICCEHVGPARVWAPEEINFSNSMADFVSLALESRGRQKAQKALNESEDKFRILAETTDSAIFVFRDRFLYVNPAMQDILGYDIEEFLCMELRDVIHDEMYPIAAQFKQQYQSGVEENIREEVRVISKNGDERWLFITTGLIQYEQQPAILATAFDISERKQMEDQLRHEAFHDKLTTLPNRALFTDRVEHVMDRYARKPGYVFAVLFIDLDRFKVINDSLGHLVGDKLLVEVGRRLKHCLRPEDTVTRLGGDEFTILMEDLNNMDYVLNATKRIQKKLAEPFTVDSHEIITTASIGIAFSSDRYSKADQILRDADIAMYRAKCNGKSRYEIFDEEMHTRALKLLEMENDLRSAIQRKEFVLHYQPIMELRTGKVIGFESLIRWEHPKLGLIPPNDFIPLAEETGMIVEIGDWVLMQACRQIKRWEQLLCGAKPPTVNINISGKQLAQEDITQRIITIIEQCNIDSSCLKLELTESMVMENPTKVSTIITELKQHHIQTAIDDFGTGYSSLSYLHKFPIDTLKIDRSFINMVGPEEQNTEIVNTIVILAHSLGLDVVAEGVENEAQLQYLQSIGCEYGQGYYYAKPLPADQVIHMLVDEPQILSKAN